MWILLKNNYSEIFLVYFNSISNYKSPYLKLWYKNYSVSLYALDVAVNSIKCVDTSSISIKLIFNCYIIYLSISLISLGTCL